MTTKNKDRDRRISRYSLEKASEHVFYEAAMFFETERLLTRAQDQTTINILLESFAIHTRNLFEFLYPKQGKTLKKSPPKPTDILATDYIEKSGYYIRSRTKKKQLEFVWRKASKQVTHLTYTRNRYTKDTKPWNFVDISSKIHRSLQAFYDALPEDYKKWTFFVDLSKLL